MTYTYVHHSGRFDRTADSLIAGFKHDVARGGDVIAFTEVDAEGRWDHLLEYARLIGWEGYRPGENTDDVGFLWNSSRFSEVVGWGKVLSSIKTYSTKGKLLKPFAGTFLVLEDKVDKKRRGFGGAHTPSHVDVGSGWRRVRGRLTNRVRQYVGGMPSFNSQMNGAMARHGVKSRVFSMDLNINLKNAWSRRYLKAAFPKYTIARDRDNAATHAGGRRIDGIFLGGNVHQIGDVKVYSAPDSDHRTIAVELS